MHIAAVMAVLDMGDLDHNTKHALVMIACRADRYTAQAEVSTRRVAADMAVSYHTAETALDRAVKAGYLIVDKSPRRTPIWQLHLRDFGSHLRDSGSNLRGPGPRSKEKKDIEGSAAAPLDSGGAVENQPAADFAAAARRLRLIRNQAGA